jgi:FtsH-binding integral membrane protein
MQGRFNWFAVLALFMITGYVAERLARSDTSRGLQYLGLGIAVVAEGILLQPMLWVAMAKFGDLNTQMAIAQGLMGHPEAVTHAVMGGLAGKIILESVGITLSIFIGLSATVFISKKDFSFMRGALSICAFGALGVIVASMIFGFQLGALFSGFMIILMAGYILYQTSQVMSYFPPTGYVAASLMLFSTIATLFWYVLRLMMELNGRR